MSDPLRKRRNGGPLEESATRANGPVNGKNGHGAILLERAGLALPDRGHRDADESVMEPHVEALLELLGEDPDRDGLRRTPHRVAQALRWLTRGYDMDPVAILRKAMFEEQHESMVLVRDIELYSLCEHHMLPFFGRAHI